MKAPTVHTGQLRSNLFAAKQRTKKEIRRLEHNIETHQNEEIVTRMVVFKVSLKALLETLTKQIEMIDYTQEYYQNPKGSFKRETHDI